MWPVHKRFGPLDCIGSNDFVSYISNHESHKLSFQFSSLLELRCKCCERSKWEICCFCLSGILFFQEIRFRIYVCHIKFQRRCLYIFFACRNLFYFLKTSINLYHRWSVLYCTFITWQGRWVFWVGNVVHVEDLEFKTYAPSVSKWKLRFRKSMGLRSFFTFLAQNCVYCIALSKRFPAS
jgi:hypothetical protein